MFVGGKPAAGIAVGSVWIGLTVSYVLPRTPPSFAILAVATRVASRDALSLMLTEGSSVCLVRGADGTVTGMLTVRRVSELLSEET